MRTSPLNALSIFIMICGLVVANWASAAPEKSARYTVPIVGSGTPTSPGAAFDGTFTIDRFVATSDGLIALGTLKGTVSNAGMKIGTVVKSMALPVNTTQPVQIAQESCPILHLELGPLDLDLLGLLVHLDRVVLDITAQPGAGNLLGNLLCAIVGLLDPASPLEELARLLNQLLGLLG
jgi:hypothetical protein